MFVNKQSYVLILTPFLRAWGERGIKLASNLENIQKLLKLSLIIIRFEPNVRLGLAFRIRNPLDTNDRGEKGPGPFIPPRSNSPSAVRWRSHPSTAKLEGLKSKVKY